MLAVFIMKCLSISTTYHFQSEHIRPHPRFTPLCGHLVRCHMLFVVNVFLRLTPPLSPALSHFSPLINQVAETKHPKFTSMPRTCFVSGGLLRPRSIKSMYISAPNGLRVNGLEEDKDEDEEMAGRCQCRLTPADRRS